MSFTPDVDSSSTYAEVVAAFEDNAAYDVYNSTDRCKQFINAALLLLRRTPAEVEKATVRVKESTEEIRMQVSEARRWLRANDSDYDGTTKRSKTLFRDFRDYRD